MRKSILGAIGCAAVGSFAFFGVASPAEADSVQISASGEWGPRTLPIFPWSARNASWSFSFDLPNPISRNPTSQVTNFNFTLNGTEVAKSLFASMKVEFFPADEAGMFDLIFQDGDVVSLYGADIGTSLTIDTGTFSAEAGMNMHPASGRGTMTVSPLTVIGFGGAVPESSTWVMMTLGFAGLVFAGYRTSRTCAIVA
jgi:hypothetical protein